MIDMLKNNKGQEKELQSEWSQSLYHQGKGIGKEINDTLEEIIVISDRSPKQRHFYNKYTQKAKCNNR